MPDLTKPTLAWTLQWDADWVTSVAFLGASRRVAAGNNLGQILVWDLPAKTGGDPPKPILRLDGHSNVVSRLAATPDGRVLISASYDHTIRYWDGTATAEANTPIVLNASAIADAQRRKNNGARVPPPNPATVGLLQPTRTLDAHKEWVIGMELSRDGKTLITGDDAGQVIIWDRGSGNILKRWQVKGWAYAVSLSPDQSQACVSERVPLVFDSGRHAAMKIWDVKSGDVKFDLSATFKGQHMACAAYSLDGQVLAVARGGEGDAGIVSLIDPATGKKTRELTPGHQYGATDLVFHPDGQHLASSGRDTVVRIWNVASGKLVSEVGKPRGGQFKDWIHAISWSADGVWLAAADMAGAVQVWTFA